MAVDKTAYWERVIDGQQSQIDVQRVLASFVAGISAAVGGTLWQTHGGLRTGIDQIQGTLVAASLVLAVAVFVTGLIREPNYFQFCEHFAQQYGRPFPLRPEDEAEAYLLGLVAAGYILNPRHISYCNRLTALQVFVALASVAVAGISLWG